MQTALKITLLGTGTSQGVPVIACECKVCTSEDPRDKRLRSAVLIQHQNTNIVVDVGPDFRQQMLTHDVKWLDAVMITHEHNDHVIGLDDVRPFNFLMKKELPVYCLERVANEIKGRFQYIFNENPYPGVPKVALKHIDKTSVFSVGEMKIQAIEVMHGSLKILGFKIGRFAYITDAKHLEESELEKLKDIDVLVLNALHQWNHHSHLNLEEAIEFSKKVSGTKIHLTHLSHHMGTHQETMDKLPDNMSVAYDGMQLEVPYEALQNMTP